MKEAIAYNTDKRNVETVGAGGVGSGRTMCLIESKMSK